MNEKVSIGFKNLMYFLKILGIIIVLLVLIPIIFIVTLAYLAYAIMSGSLWEKPEEIRYEFHHQ